jgi:hypothetical protein
MLTLLCAFGPCFMVRAVINVHAGGTNENVGRLSTRHAVAAATSYAQIVMQS